jgi:hypothetical protein
MATIEKGSAIKAIVVAAPNFRSVEFEIQGTSPFVMNKFSSKAKSGMMAAMGELKGQKGKGSNAKRDPINWAEKLDGAIHYSVDGWIGIPAASFRAAAISACRIVGFKMTMAKLGIFVRPDGFDRDEGSPLVRLYGDYRAVEHVVRLATGVASITSRPMWDAWSAKIVVDYDGDMFSQGDLYNLFSRVGLQVGIGEGRPDSKNSAGMGWGTFRIVAVKELV